jgi:hypothetical protein
MTRTSIESESRGPSRTDVRLARLQKQPSDGSEGL